MNQHRLHSSPRALRHTLKWLESEGYITQSPPHYSPEQAAYWQELGYQTAKLASRLDKVTFAIQTIGQVEAATFKQACLSAGLRFSATPDLTIVLTHDYLDPELEVINARAVRAQNPWLLVKLNGSRPCIGPLFQPEDDHAACWNCLSHRILLHDQETKLYRSLSSTQAVLPRPLVRHPLSEQLAANTTVLELIAWVYHGSHPGLSNGIISLDTRTGARSQHRLVKRPQCPACGDPELLMAPPQPIELKPAPAPTRHATNLPGKDAARTFRRYEHHVSSITGIAPYLIAFQPYPGAPVFNYRSGKNLALQSNSLFWLNRHLRSRNGGTGRTALQAKTAALCEAIERYSLLYHGPAYSIHTTYSQLEDAIDPNSCMLYSDAQFRYRELTNAVHTKFYALVPIRFDTEKPMSWTPVYSLTEKKFKFLPSSFCYAQYPAEDETKLYAYPDSNGCAAGDSLEEAILQGFLELVERDAAGIWWYNRIPRAGVDLASANNPFIDELAAYYAKIDRSLTVLDITTDLNIPVFVSISHNLDPDKKDQILYAFGAHVDPGIALERAIVEMNQLLPAVVQTQNGYLTEDPVFIDWLETATLDQNTYLIPSQQARKDIGKDYTQPCAPAILERLQFCIRTVQDAGMETLVLDLTQPDVGMPVAKVMVPGLRHFWRRTAPGRLYDVPVKMGWLSQPYHESQLNPNSIFI